MENLRFRGRLLIFLLEFDRDACWLYPGVPHSNGYCTVSVTLPDGTHRHIMAHRLAYIMLRGDIPSGLDLDHLCRTPRCINPWHMEAVTQFVNWQRGESVTAKHARQTHCKNGHELSGTNLISGINKNGRPTRQCRICYNAWQRRRRTKFLEELREYDRRRWPSRSPRKGASNAEKTHCPRGHPFSGDNLVIVHSEGRRRRRCRACHRERSKIAYHLRQKRIRAGLMSPKQRK